MSEHFDIERDLPAELWLLMEACGEDPAKGRQYLSRLPREELVDLFRGFLEAKVEMTDRLATSKRAAGASEDTLDELADSLVTLGKDIYVSTYRDERALPEPSEWRQLPGMTSVFCVVYHHRFGGEIHDEVDLSE